MAKMNIKVDREIMTVMLEKVRNGQIAIPRFQRDFIWSPKQITEFFDSILRQYPIGSLILWMPEKDEFRTLDNLEGIEVASVEKSEMWYVLDGRQRITTLLSTLYEGGNNARKYYVNLDDFHVVYWNRTSQPTKMHWLCLSEALDSFALVGYLERLKNSNLSDSKKTEYANKAKEVNKTLMAYEISYTIVRGGGIEDAVEIFSRLNSKTTLISTDYMIQALAYDTEDDFLFADTISDIKQGLEQYGLGNISREVILKCVYNYTNKAFVDCKAEDLLEIKKDLKSITSKLKDDTLLVAKFLNEECGVIDSRLLPYIYQFVMLSLFFRYNKELTAEQTLKLKRWFFYTTYSSYFTSTSLGEIRKSINNFSRFCKGELKAPIDYENQVVVTELPDSWSLGSVRACAYILCLINKYRPKNIECFDIFTIPATGKRKVANAICCFEKSDKSTLAHLFKDGIWDDWAYTKYGISIHQFDLYKHGNIDEFIESRLQSNQAIEERFITELFNETNISFVGISKGIPIENIDKRVFVLLQWLCKETDWYITHPFDVDRLHEVANLMAELDLPFNIEQIKSCCADLHWPEKTVTQIIDAISVARSHRYKTLNRINKESLMEIVSEAK